MKVLTAQPEVINNIQKKQQDSFAKGCERINCKFLIAYV